MLTNNCLYEVMPGMEIKAGMRKRKLLSDIHSVEADPHNPNGFTINFFAGHQSVKSKAIAGLNMVKRTLKLNTQFSDFLKSKTFLCSSPMEHMEWMLVLPRVVRNFWQKLFEDSLVRAPEVYQSHAFCIKDSNHRVLLLTNVWVYNVEVAYHPTTIHSVKWARPVVSLKCISFGEDEGLPDITLSFDEREAKTQLDSVHQGTKQSDFAKKQTFLFRTTAERDRTILKLRQLYVQATGRVVSVFRRIEDDATDEPEREIKDPLSTMTAQRGSKSCDARSEILSGEFVKLGKGIQAVRMSRAFKVYDDCSITWRGSRERILFVSAVPADSTLGKKLSEKDRSLAFQLITSGKILVLLASSAEIKQNWTSKIEAQLGKLYVRKA